MNESAPISKRHGTGEHYRKVLRSKPVKWWHESIADDMLAFPMDTQRERAKRLGYSENYLSMIVNSDMFKAYFAQRRLAHQEQLKENLVGKTTEAAGKALDLLLETMDQKRTAIPFDKLADFADKSLGRLGYGNGGKAAPVQVNVDARTAVAVSKEDLAGARSVLRDIESRRATETLPLPSPTEEPEGSA